MRRLGVAVGNAERPGSKQGRSQSAIDDNRSDRRAGNAATSSASAHDTVPATDVASRRGDCGVSPHWQRRPLDPLGPAGVPRRDDSGSVVSPVDHTCSKRDHRDVDEVHGRVRPPSDRPQPAARLGRLRHGRRSVDYSARPRIRTERRGPKSADRPPHRRGLQLTRAARLRAAAPRTSSLGLRHSRSRASLRVPRSSAARGRARARCP